MQLVFEVCDTASGELPVRKVFDGVGGVIGRGADCDWSIPDPRRLMSSQHGLVSYRDGRYFLTDVSSNGIGVSGGMERLCKGRARLISDGDVYQFGALDVRARLQRCESSPSPLIGAIPDDAFLGLDPVHTLECERLRGESSHDLDALEVPAPGPRPLQCRGTVDRDHLIVPKWAEPASAAAVVAESLTASPAPTEFFWVQFADALGMPLDVLDSLGREAVATKVAGLLRQAIDGLQQNLRTRDELNHELNLRWAGPAPTPQNPLESCVDAKAALASLLGADALGQCDAHQLLAQAGRDMQIHQLALSVACRTAVRRALADFAPGHLLQCFERTEKPPRFSTDGGYWRAYLRHYRRQTDDGAPGEQLLSTAFAHAYEEQVRLASTLHAAYPG